MANPNLPAGDGDYIAVISLETENHAATVGVAAGMVELSFLGPVAIVKATLARREAREVALAVIDASQQTEEGNR
jgi:hypothetical protein